VTEPVRRGAAAPGEAEPLPPERLLHDWRAAYDRANAYLGALEAAPEEARELAWRAVVDAASDPCWEPGAGAIAATLARLRRALVAFQGGEASAEPGGFLRWRLARGLAGSPGSVRDGSRGYRTGCATRPTSSAAT